MHPYGCRVVQRVLEHGTDDQVNMIMDELKRSAGTLVQDQVRSRSAGLVRSRSSMIVLIFLRCFTSVAMAMGRRQHVKVFFARQSFRDYEVVFEYLCVEIVVVIMVISLHGVCTIDAPTL